jgi:hypothetical protein
MPDMSRSFDELVERIARSMARRVSRRRFIGKIGRAHV